MEKMISPFSKEWSSKNALDTLYARKKHVGTTFYFKESIVKAAGLIFGALSLISSYQLVHTCVWLKSLPSVIKKRALAYSLITVGLAVSSFFCFKKKTFWNDPYFIAKRGVDAAEDIRKNRLGYLEIQKKYGSEIKQHNILSDDDLRNLLQWEVSTAPNYSRFKARNGNEALNLFQKEALLALFEKECKNFKGNSTSLLADFEEEQKHFDLQNNTILNWVIHAQIQDVLNQEENYFNFRHKHASIALLNLNAVQKGHLKILFLKEVQNCDFGMIAISNQYADDLALFDICSQEIKSIILPLEAKRTTSYKTFKERNGEDSVSFAIATDPSCQVILKEKFFESSYSVMSESLWDYQSLKITVDEVFARISLDIERLSYDQFIEKHTTSIFTEWSFTELEKDQLKSKFLDKIIRDNQGLLTISSLYTKETEVLNISEAELNNALLPYEVKRAQNFKQFSQRNGDKAHLNLLELSSDYKAELHELFFKEDSFELLLSESNLKMGQEIGLQRIDIENEIKKKWINLSYPQVRRFLNQGEALSTDIKEILKDKLGNYVKACDISEIEKLKKDALFFNMSLTHLYANRWGKMPMMAIIKKDLDIFKVQIKKPGMEPLRWTAKTIKEIEEKSLSFKNILTNYEPCFELKILTKNSVISGRSVYEMAEKAINPISFMEFYSNYGREAFNLFNLDSFILKEKINSHLEQNCEGILKETDEAYHFMVSSKLIS